MYFPNITALFLLSLLFFFPQEDLYAAPPVIHRFSVPSTPVDVTSIDALFYIEIDFSADEPLSSVTLTFAGPEGRKVQIPVSQWTLGYQLVENPRSGSLRIPCVMPAHHAAGLWTASAEIRSLRTFATYRTAGSTAFPVGTNAVLTVVNHGAIDDGTLLTTSSDMTSVDLTSESKSVVFTLTAANQFGLESIYIGLQFPNLTALPLLRLSESNRIAGTAYNGTYRATMHLPPYLPPGSYDVKYFTSGLHPMSSTSTSSTSTRLLPDTVTKLEVLNSGEIDRTPPEILSIHADTTSLDTTSGPQTVVLSLTLKDTQSGLGTVFASLEGPNLPGRSFVLIENPTPPFESGTITRDFSLVIPRYTPAGVYKWGFFLNDGARNFRNYFPENSESYPGGMVASLTITNNNPPGKPSIVESFKVSPAQLMAGSLPALMEFTAKLVDDLDITGVWASFFIPPFHNRANSIKLERVSGGPRDGTWVGRGPLPVGSPPGEYFFQLEIYDAGGDYVRIPELFYYSNGKSLPSGWPPPLTLFPGGNALSAYQTWVRGYPSFNSSIADEKADADGDGFPNALEFLCGTDPLLPTHPGGSDPFSSRLYWNPENLRMEYQLSASNATLGSGTSLKIKGWKSPTLAPSTWIPVDPISLPENRLGLSLDPPSSSHPSQFLRLTVEP